MLISEINYLEEKIFLLLVDFLRENNCLDEYCQNVCKHHSISVDGMSLRERTEHILKSMILNIPSLESYEDINGFFVLYETSFPWQKSVAPKDDNWYGISKKWMKFLRLKNKEYNIGLEKLEGYERCEYL